MSLCFLEEIELSTEKTAMADRPHILQPVEAKLLPPHTAGIVLRDDTLRGYEAALPRKLTLISAPTGYGKTSTTAAALELGGLTTAWYTIDDLDHEKGVLLAGVTHALRALLPGFGDELLELLNQPPKELPSNVELAAVFARAYSALAHHSIHLVLDDYHTVAESHALNRLLNSLLSYTPPSLHFVVLSRRNPQFATTKLKLAGEIGSIGLDLLRLERTQAGRAVEQRTGRAWSEEDLEKLLLLTEGWPAGIALAGALNEGDARNNATEDPLLPSAGHASFLDLAEQAYRDEEEEFRFILMRTCLLSTITAERVRHIASPTCSNERFERLAASSVFLLPAKRRGAYRHHRLFYEFLELKCLESFGRASLRLLHLKSADMLKASNDIPGAVDLLLKIDEPARALEALERADARLLDELPSSLLCDWLNRLPARLHSTNPMCLVLCSQVLLRKGYSEAALRKAEEAAQLSSDQRSSSLLQALTIKERIYSSRGLRRRSRSVYNDALLLARSDGMRAHIFIDIGLTALKMGSRRGVSEAFSRAERFLDGVDTREAARLRLARCLTTYNSGEFKAARLQSVGIDEEITITDMRLCPTGLRGIIEASTGDLASARDLLERALRRAMRQGDDTRSSFLQSALASCLASSGEATQALHEIESICRTAASHISPSLTALVFNTLGTILRRQGDPKEAATCHRKALNAATKGRSLYASLDSLINLSFSESLTLDERALDLPSFARQAENAGLRFLALKAKLFHATLPTACEDEEARKAALADCIPQQLELGHFTFLTEELTLAEPSLSSYLAQETRGIHVDTLLRCITHHWRGPSTLAKLLCAPHASLTEPILSLVKEELPTKAQIEVLRASCKTSSKALRRRLQIHLSGLEARLSNPHVPLPELTRREYHVLSLIASGLHNQGIAAELILSPTTIKTHINRIFMKLGVTTRVQAIFAYQSALARSEEPPEESRADDLSTLIQPTV